MFVLSSIYSNVTVCVCSVQYVVSLLFAGICYFVYSYVAVCMFCAVLLPFTKAFRSAFSGKAFWCILVRLCNITLCICRYNCGHVRYMWQVVIFSVSVSQLQSVGVVCGRLRIGELHDQYCCTVLCTGSNEGR